MCDWANRQAETGCYSWTGLSSNNSKTRYVVIHNSCFWRIRPPLRCLLSPPFRSSLPFCQTFLVRSLPPRSLAAQATFYAYQITPPSLALLSFLAHLPNANSALSSCSMARVGVIEVARTTNTGRSHCTNNRCKERTKMVVPSKEGQYRSRLKGGPQVA